MKFSTAFTAIAALAGSVAAMPAAKTTNDITARQAAGEIVLLSFDRSCGGYFGNCRYEFSLFAADDYLPGVPGFSVLCLDILGGIVGRSGSCSYAPAGHLVNYLYVSSSAITITHIVEDKQVASGTVAYDGFLGKYVLDV